MLPVLQSITICLISIIAFVIIALYFYFTRNFKFWHKLGIPYVKPTPFVGNLKDCAFLKTGIWQVLKDICHQNSDKPYVGFFAFDKPNLLIRDVELVKNVLVKDFLTFVNRPVAKEDKLDPLFINALGLIRDQRWRYLRTKLAPVFTSGKLKKMFYLVDTCGKDLAEYLDRATGDGSCVEVKDASYRLTTDAIASCAFGINSNSFKHPDAEFRRYLKIIFDFTVGKALAMLAAVSSPYVKSLLQLRIFDEDTNNYIRNIVWSTVEYREKHGVTRNDFLDCMMELRKNGMEETKEDILGDNYPTQDGTLQIEGDFFVAQAFQFLTAGYETSGSTLCYALYEIALHPEIQHRLRAEILAVLNKHNGQLTYDGIQEMSYLDMVVSETLRLYPSLSFLARESCSDFSLPAPNGRGTVTLPAGIGVYISVLALHHDPTYFPEPEKFDPDRFTEENKYSRPKYTYLPFGEGPRMCIGMRFAQMTVKTALCHILSRFEVAPCKDTPVPIVFDPKCVLLTGNKDIPLSIKRIQF